MNVLEINLTILYAISFFGLIKSKAANRFFLVVATVFLVVFNGFRNINVGTDTFRYYKRFEEIRNANSLRNFLNIKVEFGYKLSQKVFQIFNFNFNYWLLLVAIFMFILFAIVIRKHSKNYFISFFLFITLGYYDFSFTGIRQIIAIIIVLFSYRYILSKSFNKFLITCLIASSFHSSALVFLPMYYLSRIKWRKKHSIFLIAFLVLIYKFRLQIGKLLTVVYYDEASSIMLDKYLSSGHIGRLAIMTLLVLGWGIVSYNPYKNNNFENIVLSNIIFVSTIIQMISSFSYLFTRLNMYFMIFLVLYIPNVLENIEISSIKITKMGLQIIRVIYMLAFLIVLTVYYINSIRLNASNILPYTFW